MIFGLGWPNWTRLGVWLIIGLVLYFSYGQKHSKLQQAKS
jgi:APA family basic amino acid/polyamine antiporter